MDADSDGYVAAPDGDDCDDTDPTVHPGAEEVCGDGTDQDCDGVELGCTGVIHATEGGGWLEGGGQAFGVGKGLAVVQGWRSDGGPTVAVTAPWWQVEPYDNRGAVFFVQPDSFGYARQIEDHADAVLTRSERDQILGWSISVGDVDGDGVDDVALGEPGTDEPDKNGWDPVPGGAWVVFGPVSQDQTIEDSHAVYVEGWMEYGELGTDVELDHDVTGDGLVDLVAGWPSGCWDDQDVGGAVVVENSSLNSQTIEEPDHFLWGEASCVGLQGELDIGDLDGDGVGDVVMGGHAVLPKDNGDDSPVVGVLYVTNGPITQDTALADADWTIWSDEASTLFGLAISVVGDVHGDGFPDVMVGATWDSTGASAGGAAYVFAGGTEVVAGTARGHADATILGNIASMELGNAVEGAGDLNADGHADLLVSAESSKADGYRGQVFVFAGPVSGTLTQENAILEVRGRYDSDHFGTGWLGWGGSLLGGVDLNDDGFDDWLAAADLANEDYIGAVYSFYGGAW